MKQTVLIVGAGIIGCSLADELTRRGAAVTVVDAAEVGSATSAATFAWVNSNDKSPHEYSRLNLLGLQAHERAARSAGKGGSRWFHQIGNVQIAQTDDEMAAIELKVQQHAAKGYEAQLLSAANVRDLEPWLQAPRLKGGALFPKEGWVDTLTMCSSLVNRAVEAGAVFAPYETVTNVQPNLVTTRTPDGDVRHRTADVIVLAAGNGNRGILSTAGIDFPTLEPTRSGSSGKDSGVGIISNTGPVRSGIRHIVRAEGIAMRPARNGGITFADHPTGGKWDLDDPRIWTVPALLLDRVRELYPSMKDAANENVRLGIRVLPEDGLTIADWIIDDHSLYAVATHSGVTLAAHLAETVAEEVLTGTRHESLESFGLSRFSVASETAEAGTK